MKKFKQITALILVILWALLILATLVTAFIDGDNAKKIFIGLIYTDIALPVALYIIIFFSKMIYKNAFHHDSDDTQDSKEK